MFRPTSLLTQNFFWTAINRQIFDCPLPLHRPPSVLRHFSITAYSILPRTPDIPLRHYHGCPVRSNVPPQLPLFRLFNPSDQSLLSRTFRTEQAESVPSPNSFAKIASDRRTSQSNQRARDFPYLQPFRTVPKFIPTHLLLPEPNSPLDRCSTLTQFLSFSARDIHAPLQYLVIRSLTRQLITNIFDDQILYIDYAPTATASTTSA